MSAETALRKRSGNRCELCGSEDDLSVYELPPSAEGREEDSILVCGKCSRQLNKKEALDGAHWACLKDSMWSEQPAVKVASWRLLNRLRGESWAAEALEMLYLDEEQLAFAKASGDHENGVEVELHRDCNGNILNDGDNVVLTKSLDVKGSNLNAKMGTVVKGIRLVKDNVEQIEGRIEGQTIVILTKYLRKG